MPPIQKVLDEYVGKGIGWIDPFCGWTSPAELTNDINPKCPAHFHLDALDFLKKQKSRSWRGCLFDPPYSPRQLKECYEGIGYSYQNLQFQNTIKNVRNEIARIIKTDGLVISFGWNSIGIGKKHGFKLVEILLICHGGFHNDTIITLERKL